MKPVTARTATARKTVDGGMKETMDPFLAAAIAEAKTGLQEGGIPIGSALALDGAIVGAVATGACNAAAPCCMPRWIAWKTPDA